jgi:hypothetical protein
LWGAHVVAGAIHCCRFAWDKADEAFNAVLRIAHDETRARFWYAAFPLTVGRTEEAKRCVSFREREMARARFQQCLVLCGAALNVTKAGIFSDSISCDVHTFSSASLQI